MSDEKETINEEITAAETESIVEVQTTEKVVEEKPKVKFLDTTKSHNNRMTTSGDCRSCGKRYNVVEIVNGKVTCPHCNFTS